MSKKSKYKEDSVKCCFECAVVSWEVLDEQKTEES